MLTGEFVSNRIILLKMWPLSHQDASTFYVIAPPQKCTQCSDIRHDTTVSIEEMISLKSVECPFKSKRYETYMIISLLIMKPAMQSRLIYLGSPSAHLEENMISETKLVYYP